MKLQVHNYAFIDGQNLYLAIRSLDWKLDYKKFRIYLSEKYSVTKAYIFLGYLPSNQPLYSFLISAGFELIYKPILNRDGLVKGNCDAELVLQAMIDFQNYNKALIVTGDGDFYCLINYLNKCDKLLQLLIPNAHKYSNFFRSSAYGKLDFMNNLKNKLEYKKERQLHKDSPL